MTLPNELEPFASIIIPDQPLSQCTYMKVGGPADFVATTPSIETLVEVVKAAKKSGIQFYVLGGGSNTVFSDAGYRGMVILNRSSNLSIDEENKTAVSDSGVPTNLVVNQTITKGLAGLEEFLGIPGSIGGAIYNNSHYLTHLIGDYVEAVELLDSNLNQVWVNAKELDFKYDYSRLHQTGEMVLRVKFKLTAGDPEQLKQTAQAALKRRRDTQPLEMPSSGCIFKNFKDKAPLYPHLPQGIYSAGALIDAAGLKGKQVGGASISKTHANFIVNTGNATTQDIIDLSNQIISTVKEKYGLTLEREVFFVDEFGERMKL